jgi:hypothetical protein
MVKLVPVCLAVMASVGGTPPVGPDVPGGVLHPAQVEELVDQITEILLKRGTGAFALLGRWHAAGDGSDPDLFVIDMRGKLLFGAPRTVADACGDRFVAACVMVAERFGCGWVDGSSPGGASWSYVREARVDGIEALVGARVHVNGDGTLSTSFPAR